MTSAIRLVGSGFPHSDENGESYGLVEVKTGSLGANYEGIAISQPSWISIDFSDGDEYGDMQGFHTINFSDLGELDSLIEMLQDASKSWAANNKVIDDIRDAQKYKKARDEKSEMNSAMAIMHEVITRCEKHLTKAGKEKYNEELKRIYGTEDKIKAAKRGECKARGY